MSWNESRVSALVFKVRVHSSTWWRGCSVTVEIFLQKMRRNRQWRRPIVWRAGVEIKDPRLSQLAGYRSVTRDRNNLKTAHEPLINPQCSLCSHAHVVHACLADTPLTGDCSAVRTSFYRRRQTFGHYRWQCDLRKSRWVISDGSTRESAAIARQTDRASCKTEVSIWLLTADRVTDRSRAVHTASAWATRAREKKNHSR